MGAYLCHAANTFFFMYQKPFSGEWDSILNEVLEHGEFVEIREGVIAFRHLGNEIELWCANKWYSFGHAWRINGNTVNKDRQYRPRMRTMIKLWDVYQRERNKALDSEYQKLFKEAV